MENLVLFLYLIAAGCLMALLLALVYVVRRQLTRPVESQAACESDNQIVFHDLGRPADALPEYRFSPQPGPKNDPSSNHQTIPLVFQKDNAPPIPQETLEQETLSALDNVQARLTEIQQVIESGQNGFIDRAAHTNGKQAPDTPASRINLELNDLSLTQQTEESQGYLKRLSEQFRHLEHYLKARLFR